MPLYSSLLNFNHFTHIRQTTSRCWNQCVLIALMSRGRIQRVGVSTGRKGERRQTSSKLPFAQTQHLLSLFVTSKHTHSQAELKAGLKCLNALPCRWWILFQSQTAFFHWVGGRGQLFSSRKMIFNESRSTLYLFCASRRAAKLK